MRTKTLPLIAAPITALIAASTPTAAGQNCSTNFIGTTAYTNCRDDAGTVFSKSFNAAYSAASRPTVVKVGPSTEQIKQVDRDSRLASCVYAGNTAEVCAALEKEFQRAARMDLVESQAQLDASKLRVEELRYQVVAMRPSVRAARSAARGWFWRDREEVATAKVRYAAIRKEYDALVASFSAAERAYNSLRMRPRP
jgi:hypothetical protein